jgi:hypothetical protein
MLNWDRQESIAAMAVSSPRATSPYRAVGDTICCVAARHSSIERLRHILCNVSELGNAYLLHGHAPDIVLEWEHELGHRVRASRETSMTAADLWQDGTNTGCRLLLQRLHERLLLPASPSLTSPDTNHHVGLSGTRIWLSVHPLDKRGVSSSVLFVPAP